MSTKKKNNSKLSKLDIFDISKKNNEYINDTKNQKKLEKKIDKQYQEISKMRNRLNKEITNALGAKIHNDKSSFAQYIALDYYIGYREKLIKKIDKWTNDYINPKKDMSQLYFEGQNLKAPYKNKKYSRQFLANIKSKGWENISIEQLQTLGNRIDINNREQYGLLMILSKRKDVNYILQLMAKSEYTLNEWLARATLENTAKVNTYEYYSVNQNENVENVITMMENIVKNKK